MDKHTPSKCISQFVVDFCTRFLIVGMEVGSEHTMDGEAYPLEVHFVFHNSRFEDLDAAAADGGRDNLLVVGQFFEVGESLASNYFVTILQQARPLASSYFVNILQ